MRLLDHKLLLTLICQAVVFELPISIRGRLPFGIHPSSLFQTMQCGIKGAVLHLEELVRSPLNVFADLVTVSRATSEGPQYEHVQGSL
jgi:hypothetical protein